MQKKSRAFGLLSKAHLFFMRLPVATSRVETGGLFILRTIVLTDLQFFLIEPPLVTAIELRALIKPYQPVVHPLIHVTEPYPIAASNRCRDAYLIDFSFKKTISVYCRKRYFM